MSGPTPRANDQLSGRCGLKDGLPSWGVAPDSRYALDELAALTRKGSGRQPSLPRPARAGDATVGRTQHL